MKRKQACGELHKQQGGISPLEIWIQTTSTVGSSMRNGEKACATGDQQRMEIELTKQEIEAIKTYQKRRMKQHSWRCDKLEGTLRKPNICGIPTIYNNIYILSFSQGTLCFCTSRLVYPRVTTTQKVPGFSWTHRGPHRVNRQHFRTQWKPNGNPPRVNVYIDVSLPNGESPLEHDVYIGFHIYVHVYMNHIWLSVSRSEQNFP